MSKVFDLFIIGGGINGAGLARDAAGRGLSVCLADKGEIGGATSSWSTKLIHGGLRYLENYEFKLVESLSKKEKQFTKLQNQFQNLFLLSSHMLIKLDLHG
jgi:glycerol-3-phosphate dehydrogenase